MSTRCRLCGSELKDGKWFERVNETGVPGIWECRPDCEAELHSDDALLMAIEHNEKNVEAFTPTNDDGE